MATGGGANAKAARAAELAEALAVVTAKAGGDHDKATELIRSSDDIHRLAGALAFLAWGGFVLLSQRDGRSPLAVLRKIGVAVATLEYEGKR